MNSREGVVYGRNHYVHTIQGIQAKRNYFAGISTDDLHQLLDFKSDVLFEYQDKRNAFPEGSRQWQTYNEYFEMIYLDCCCCFVALAERYGLQEKDFTDKQKRSFEYRTWEAIERQIYERENPQGTSNRGGAESGSHR